MLALVGALAAHVPTYGSDDRCIKTLTSTCCRPVHTDLNLSQVLYLRGSGGLEIPLYNADPLTHPDRADPIPNWRPNGFPIYFDIVLRDAGVNLSELIVHVGCGGCAPGDDLVPASLRTDLEYQHLVIEPFTRKSQHTIQTVPTCACHETPSQPFAFPSQKPATTPSSRPTIPPTKTSAPFVPRRCCRPIARRIT